MPCASPDLKQAGACGRRPGQVSGERAKQPKKNTLEASKGNQNQLYLIQLGEERKLGNRNERRREGRENGGQPFPRLAAKDGPPDTNSPNVHIKTQKSRKIYALLPFPRVSKTKFAPFPQPYQIQLVSHRPPKTDQGGFEPLTSRHHH